MALARYESVAVNLAGDVIPNATVEVREDRPGRPVVPLWADRNGTVPLGNPITTDSEGKFGFHVTGGSFYIRVFTGPSQQPLQQYVRRYQAIGTAAERDVEDLATALEAGTATFSTLADLEVFIPAAEGVGGKVTTGPSAGFYHYDDVGNEWVFDRPLYDSLARMNVTGGTADAIEAAIVSGVADSAVVMLWIEAPGDNTGAVTINGKEVVSAGGGSLIAGQWNEGRTYWFSDEGSNYKLRTESDVDGIATQVEIWANETLANKNYAEEWAQSDVPISIEAGGDGVSDKSSKSWAEASGGSAAAAAASAAGVNLPPILAGDARKQLFVKEDETGYELDVAARGGGELFKTVAQLLADNNVVLGYATSGAEVEVAAGDIITAQGFRYEVAASGATDQQITTAGGVKLYVLADRGQVVAQQFGAAGDDVTDDAVALQAWQDFGYEQGVKTAIYAKHYCSTNLIIKTDVHGTHRDRAQIVFEAGHGFRTYVDADEFYRVSLFNTGFISDKASYWNSTDAGDAFVGDVTRADVKRLYGARVWKGNKITTPNNICANDTTERQNGVGFWDKSFGQWMQTDGVVADITLAGTPGFKADSCVYYGQGNPKQIVGCKFQGFENFTVVGTYNADIHSNLFEAMKIGVQFIDASIIGGSTGTRVTTINFQANEFDDCWVSVYAQSLLQSEIAGANVFQRAIVGIYVGSGGAPGCSIRDNYFEIGHTFYYWLPNEVAGGEFGLNFTNTYYTRYLAWLNHGQRHNFVGPVSSTNRPVRVAAAVQNSSFDAEYALITSAPYFLDNGNAAHRGGPKVSVYSILGTGSGHTTSCVANDRPAPPEGDLIVPSVSGGVGLTFPNNIVILKIELLGASLDIWETYFEDSPIIPPKNWFATVFDPATSQFQGVDFRDSGVERFVRVTWTERAVPTGAT